MRSSVNSTDLEDVHGTQENESNVCGRDSVCGSGNPAKERAKWNKTWRVTARSNIQTMVACPQAFEQAVMECAAKGFVPSWWAGSERKEKAGDACLRRRPCRKDALPSSRESCKLRIPLTYSVRQRFLVFLSNICAHQ